MSRQLLFSLTKKDFVRQTFRSGGKGGQNQNKVETGVRFIHPDSGAVGESREYRTQGLNQKAAFKRLTETSKFKLWHKIRCSELLGEKPIEEIVDEAMSPENILIETKTSNNKWVELGV